MKYVLAAVLISAWWDRHDPAQRRWLDQVPGRWELRFYLGLLGLAAAVLLLAAVALLGGCAPLPELVGSSPPISDLARPATSWSPAPAAAAPDVWLHSDAGYVGPVACCAMASGPGQYLAGFAPGLR